MTPTYDLVLVTLSVVIATLASLAALFFAAQVTTATGTTRFSWLFGGATVMGIGIWSMHFVGMLAFHLPVPVEYSVPLVAVSVAVAIAASLLALVVVAQRVVRLATLLAAGTVMGAAIAGMHYIGMASMHTAAMLSYDVPVVVLSIAIAIIASTAALWLAFYFQRSVGKHTDRLRTLAALVMGIAIAGMHYTGMAAVTFAPHARVSGHDTRVLATNELGQVIAIGTLLIILTALIGVVLDRRVLQERASFAEQLRAQAYQLREQNEELEVQAEELMAQTAELLQQSEEQQRLNKALVHANARVEEALAGAERAAAAELEANRTRTRFVNMVSHELRTPLGAIGGYAQLLLMGVHGTLNGEQGRALQRITVNQHHLLNLINEMLELAKLEAGQMPLHLSQLELREMFDAARPMIDPQLQHKHITCEHSMDGALPKVIGDPEKVKQILINLLANSIRFTPDSGQISVSAHNYPHRVELRVTDSGPGIAPDKVASLFTPFLQLGLPEEQLGGTGLGLTISRELARAMGGDLAIDSTGVSGATFVLSLRTVNSPAIAVALA